MTLGLEADGEQNGEPHSWGFNPFAELTGLGIGIASLVLPICCVLGDQIIPLSTNDLFIGDASPPLLRIAAPERPGLDR